MLPTTITRHSNVGSEPGPRSPEALDSSWSKPDGSRRKRRHGQPAASSAAGWGAPAWALACALGLLAVLATYRAHQLYVTPLVERLAKQQAAAGRAAAEHRRRGVLLERRSDAAAEWGEEEPAAAAAHELPAASALGDGSSGGSMGSNCTVRLAEADAALLRLEVHGMVQALSDEQHPWLAGLLDAPAEAARRNVVTRGQARVAAPGGMATVPAVADAAAFGRQSSDNVPGVQDLHAELAAYHTALVDSMVLEEKAAAARQRRTAAAELPGLLPHDPLNDTATLPQRIAFVNDLHAEVQARDGQQQQVPPLPLVCIAATTAADVWGLRRELLPWMQYHAELGVAHFYLLYDGQDAEAVRLLGTLRHVTLMHIRPPFAAPADVARFELYLSVAGAARAGGSGAAAGVGQGQGQGAPATAPLRASQPGNFGLMAKQAWGETEALRLARRDGMHWLLHLDPDELLHPGGAAATSLPAALAAVPPHVPSLRFMNFEAQPEAGDLENRFEQVTLFRVHKHFITPEAHFYRQRYRLGDSAAFLTLYANGKSAVRVDAPGVRPSGPHFFTGDPSPRWQTAANPRGEWRDLVSDDSVVLHYAYALPGDVAAKARRSCPGDEYLAAARSSAEADRAKLKDCFVIEFDRAAFVAAAQGPAAAADFHWAHSVLSEGARVRCTDQQLGQQQGWCTLTDVDRFKTLMERLGLYRRLPMPQALLRSHERQVQERLGRSQAEEQQQQWRR